MVDFLSANWVAWKVIVACRFSHQPRLHAHASVNASEYPMISPFTLGGGRARFRVRDKSLVMPANPEPAVVAIEPRTLLRIVNEIFKSNCEDLDAIDVTASWEVIIGELEDNRDFALTLALRYQPGMTAQEAGRILGVSAPRVFQRCGAALRKLREPDRSRRIRNAIVGWPNLFRDYLSAKASEDRHCGKVDCPLPRPNHTNETRWVYGALAGHMKPERILNQRKINVPDLQPFTLIPSNRDKAKR
jgi:hypothetical protein